MTDIEIGLFRVVKPLGGRQHPLLVGLQPEALAVLFIVEVLGVEVGGRKVFLEGAAAVVGSFLKPAEGADK